MATCQVTDTPGYLILGSTTAQQVGYIDLPVVTPPALTHVPQVHMSENALRPNVDEVKMPTCEIMNNAVILNGKRHCLPITQEYDLCCQGVFRGIGKLPGGKYLIELKPDAQRVQHPPRAVPEKKREAYKDEEERLCSLISIIESVAGHTYWISGIVP